MSSESNNTTSPSFQSPTTPSSSQSLSILFFGTNQYYETPQELVKKFTLTEGVNNINNNKERKLFFDYKIGSQDKATNIKFIFLNILDQEYTICKIADAYVIFVDLESIDSLDKLNNIITYIKETCRSIITTHIFGKYENQKDKIKILGYENMNEYLKDKSIVFNYQEMQTGEDDRDVIDAIKTMLQLAYDSQARIIKNKEIVPKRVVNVKNSEEDISKSICIAF